MIYVKQGHVSCFLRYNGTRMKNWTRTQKILLACILALVLVIAAEAGLYFVKKSNGEKAESTPAATAEVTAEPTASASADLSRSKVSLGSYKAYKSTSLGFGFIAADMTVDSKYDIDLSLFETEESLKLSNASAYREMLEDAGYGSYIEGTVEEKIEGSDTEYSVKLFIPVKDLSQTSLILYSDFGKNAKYTMRFNDAEELDAEETAEPTSTPTAEAVVENEEKTFKMTVLGSLEVSGDEMLSDGMSMSLPSTARVFAFRIQADSLTSDSVVVEEALFLANNDELYSAEGASVSSMKYENLIGKSIGEEEEGYLFFIVLDPEREMTADNGILQVRLAGSEEWILVDTE